MKHFIGIYIIARDEKKDVLSLQEQKQDSVRFSGTFLNLYPVLSVKEHLFETKQEQKLLQNILKLAK